MRRRWSSRSKLSSRRACHRNTSLSSARRKALDSSLRLCEPFRLCVKKSSLAQSRKGAKLNPKRATTGANRSVPVSRHLFQTSADVVLLDTIGGQREGSFIGCRCFIEATQAAQEISARGMEQVIMLERGAGGFDQTQTPLESVAHCDSSRMIQSYYGRGSDAHQLFVERNDLPPVSFISTPGFTMEGRDSTLNLIVAGAPQCQRSFDQPHTFIDFSTIPQ